MSAALNFILCRAVQTSTALDNRWRQDAFRRVDGRRMDSGDESHGKQALDGDRWTTRVDWRNRSQRWPCILIVEASLMQFIFSNRRGALLYSSSRMHTIFGSLRSVNSARECCRALRSVLQESASHHDRLLPLDGCNHCVVVTNLHARDETSNPQ